MVQWPGESWLQYSDRQAAYKCGNLMSAYRDFETCRNPLRYYNIARFDLEDTLHPRTVEWNIADEAHPEEGAGDVDADEMEIENKAEAMSYDFYDDEYTLHDTTLQWNFDEADADHDLAASSSSNQGKKTEGYELGGEDERMSDGRFANDVNKSVMEPIDVAELDDKADEADVIEKLENTQGEEDSEGADPMNEDEEDEHDDMETCSSNVDTDEDDAKAVIRTSNFN